MDPSQRNMSSTNLRLLKWTSPSPATSSLDLQTVNKDQWWVIFFYLLPDFLIFIFLFYIFFPLKGNMKIGHLMLQDPFVPFCLTPPPPQRNQTPITSINLWMLHDFMSHTVDKMNVLRSVRKKKKKDLYLAAFIDFYFNCKLYISEM